MFAFFDAHPGLMLFLAWNFSALCSAMPPPTANAPYIVKWLHDYLQIVAANLNRRTTSYTEEKTPDGNTLFKAETSVKPASPP